MLSYIWSALVLSMLSRGIRAYLNQLLCVLPTWNAIFEKQNASLSNKNYKNTSCFRGCNISHDLNLEKWGVKICPLLDFLAFFCYTTCMPLFSRISPVYKVSLFSGFSWFQWYLSGCSGRCSWQPTETITGFYCSIYFKGNHLKQ